jgi:hypothetical protein
MTSHRIACVLRAFSLAGLLAAPAASQARQATPPPEPTKSDADKLALDASPPSFFKGWTGGVEVGLNGSEGNTERLSFRAGANATRKRELT